MIERALHRGEVDGGLAGAGDAVEQVGAKSARGKLPRNLIQCLLLLRIQCEGLRLQSAEMEGQRPLLESDKLAADQSVQCRGGHRQRPQHRDRQGAAGSCERSQDGLLIFVQLRQAGDVHEYGVSLALTANQRRQ